MTPTVDELEDTQKAFVAWADDRSVVIQHSFYGGEHWCESANGPNWVLRHTKYRIKPTPDPTQLIPWDHATWTTYQAGGGCVVSLDMNSQYTILEVSAASVRTRCGIFTFAQAMASLTQPNGATLGEYI